MGAAHVEGSDRAALPVTSGSPPRGSKPGRNLLPAASGRSVDIGSTLSRRMNQARLISSRYQSM